MKKLKQVVITIIVLALIVAAAVFGLKYYKQHRFDSMEVEGVLVQNVNCADWMIMEGASYGTGIVSSDNRQVVYANENKIVKEMNVSVGDTVEKGDVLLTYDTARSDLQLEIQRIEIQQIENEIILGERQLAHLKTITPVPDDYVDPEDPTNPDDPDPVKPKDMFVLPAEKEGDAYNYIKEGAVPYDGDGTIDNPYLFLCSDYSPEYGSIVFGSYLNYVIENGLVVKFNIFEGNDLGRGDLKSTYKFDGNIESEVSDDEYYSTKTGEIIVWEYVEPEEPEDPSDPIPDDGSPEFDRYTEKELREAIEEQEKELKRLDFSKRKQELELQKLEKSMESPEVVAAVSGVVTKAGDIDQLLDDEFDQPILIEVSSSVGKFLTGSVSELELDSIHVGDIIYATSWSTNESYEAVVTEVLDYPTSDGNYYSYGNNGNVSYYPFKAFIEDASGLDAGEALDLSISDNNNSKKAEIVLEKSYVRKESGKSYVFVCDENDRLVKRYVETGKSYDGYYIEILSGLSLRDFIVFPYGSNVREGVKCTHEVYTDDYFGDSGDEYVDDTLDESADDELSEGETESTTENESELSDGESSNSVSGSESSTGSSDGIEEESVEEELE